MGTPKKEGLPFTGDDLDDGVITSAEQVKAVPKPDVKPDPDKDKADKDKKKCDEVVATLSRAKKRVTELRGRCANGGCVCLDEIDALLGMCNT